MALTDGDYFIVSGYSPTLYMDVTHGNRNNGANVRVWHKDSTDNQLWQVTTRSDGSRQITSRFTGKSLDVKADAITTVGTNVQMYTDTDNRNQKWDVEDSGTTVTIDGTTYPLYKVVLTDAPTMCAELYGNTGFTDGSNVCIAGYTGASDQLWAFIPVPPLQSGGIYELALRLDPRYALDVASGSPANGANAILTGRHNANDHKFYLTERSTDHWILRNIASGKNLEVQRGIAATRQNVQQWQQTNDRREEWKPVTFGTQSYQGADRTIIKLYSWVDGVGNTYIMDANQNSKLDLGNICIVETDPDDQGQYSQQWLLIPTLATDPNMAIPSEMGWSAFVGDPSYNRDRGATETLYPTWECTSAWATSGPNHYMWRYRSRLMDGGTSTYGDWSEWTDWQTALVTQEGQRAWFTEGLPATFDNDAYKVLDYQYEVKTVGVGETAAVEGQPASTIVRAMYRPDVSLSNAGFGPEGLRLAYSSDYTNGTNVITLQAIVRDGENILAKPVRIDGLETGASVSVPIDALTAWIEDGDSLQIEYSVGTDQWPEFDGLNSDSVQVSYDAGQGASLSPTVSMGRGRRLSIDLQSSLPTQAVYLRTRDGEVFVCENDNGVFSVDYPFGVPFDLYAVAASSDGATWDLWHQALSEHSDLLRQYPPCHAWGWDGGSFLLECATDPMLTDRTMSAIYEADALNRREYQSVYFAHTIQSEYMAEGLLYDGLTESDKDELISLLKARHVTYRAPSGEIADVAVTSISYQTHREYTIVQVNMIEETL